jgi:hypothetical protein
MNTADNSTADDVQIREEEKSLNVSLPPFADLISGYQKSQFLFTFHRLRLADALHQAGQLSLSDLANMTRIEVQLLEQVLEIAQRLNILHQDEQQQYRLTEQGQRLRTDVANSIIPWLDYENDGYIAWEKLHYSLQTGKVAFEQAYQTDFFSYLKQHPDKETSFNRFMEQTTQEWLSIIGHHYEFAGHVIDIGGNTGALTALLLQQNPDLRATLFDVEHVVSQSESVLAAAGVAERCQVVAGNFFEPTTIPTNGDIYLISRVLLNWNDDQVMTILQNCHACMPPHSKLLILDFVLTEHSPLPLLLNSLHLWVMFGARFRRQSTFEQFVQQAGFTHLRWITVNEMLFLLEARPAPI